MKKIVLLISIIAVCSQGRNLVHEEDISTIGEFIAHWEGYRNEVYTCPAGYKTIGIGHKLKKGENFVYLTDQEIDAIFNQDLEVVYEFMPKYIKDMWGLPEIVQYCLIDLGFNLGETRFAKFKKTIEACNARDFELMSKELKDSKWYHQVGRRSRHHVQALANQN